MVLSWILFEKTWHKLSCAPCRGRRWFNNQNLRKYCSYNKNQNISRCAKNCSFKWYHEKSWKQLQNCVSLSFFSSWTPYTIKIEPCALRYVRHLIYNEAQIKEHQANLGSLQSFHSPFLQLPRSHLLIEYSVRGLRQNLGWSPIVIPTRPILNSYISIFSFLHWLV